MCCGDSCCFPIVDDGCSPDQLGGPSLLTNGSSSVRECLGNGVVRMRGICGNRGEEVTVGEDFVSGDNSFRFPITGSSWIRFHSGGVGLLTDGSFSVRGCLGSKGVVRLGVIEMIRGNCDEDATGVMLVVLGKSCDDDAAGGDGCGVILGKGGMSHGRGMESSEEGAVHLTSGNGTLSVCWVTGIDVVKDEGKGMLTGSGVSSIGEYCSIDEYCCRCDPQGTRGSGGDAIRGGSTGGGLGWVGIWMKGDGSTRGGDGILVTTGGSGMTSLDRDDDGWINCRMTGIGPT